MTVTTESMEVSVVEHCNLKCRNCSHFSPLLDESFYPIDEYARDVRALAAHYHTHRIRFVGGEPLLHPDLGKFPLLSKQAGICDQTVLVTNALLLGSQPAERFTHFDRIHISAYTSVKLDFAVIVKDFSKRLAAHGRRIAFEIRHGSTIHPRDLTPDERTAYEAFRDRYVQVVGGYFRKIDDVMQPQPADAAPRDLLLTIKFEDRFAVVTPDEPLDAQTALASYQGCRQIATCQSLYRGRFYKCPRPQNMRGLARHRPAMARTIDDNFGEIDGIDVLGADLGPRLTAYLSSRRPLASCTWCRAGLASQVYEPHAQERRPARIK